MTNKMKQSVAGRMICALVIAAVVLADQLTKAAAVGALKAPGNSVTAIPGALDFTYVLNRGATAGILADRRWIFMAVSGIVIVAGLIILLLGKIKSNFTAVAVAMIIGGGIGNMIDRVANGEVVDFIDVTLVDFFPFNTVFNLADTFVCVGCVLLIVSVIAGEIKDRKKKDDAETPEDGETEA
ncbi:MAG: signal peptidase II [Clostridia bacterium]|nr:signal peptidase II [Clostridia bacterium]